MCIRDSQNPPPREVAVAPVVTPPSSDLAAPGEPVVADSEAVSYTHLRAHETVLDLVCRLLLEKKKKTNEKRTMRLP